MNIIKQKELMAHAASGNAQGVADLLGLPPYMLDVDYQSHPSKESALIMASDAGHVDVVRILVNKGVHLNLQNAEGDTALIIATRRGNTEIVKLLLDKGAALDLKNYMKPDMRLSSYQDAESGFAPTVEEMQEERAEWDRQKKEDGTTALMVACQCGHTDIAQLLIDKGADLDLPCRGDRGSSLANSTVTALYAASYNGHVDIVRSLIDKGAESALKNGSVLIAASERGHVNIVQFLIDRGVNLDLQNGSALWWAVHYGHTGVVKLLIDKGANLSLRVSGDTVLDSARKRDQTEVAALLAQAMAKLCDTKEAANALLGVAWGEKLVDCADAGDITEMAEMIRQGADINYRRSSGVSALMSASLKGHLGIVQLLVGKGANLDLQDSYRQNTALMWASQKGHVDIVKLLIDKGANLNLTGKYKDPGDHRVFLFRALDYARQAGRNSKVVELLEEAGAKAFHEG